MSRRSTLLRGAAWLLVLAATLHFGAKQTGPVPPLGRVLDPVNGIWSVATVVDFPAEEVIAIPGMSDSVRVLFDDRGVPHIFATSSEDAARALGYVVARDRLFQMELRWRTAAGRLTELVGDRALPVDRRIRGLGLAWSADRDLGRLDSESQAYRDVISYAEGINAWIDGMRRRDLPLEYHLLDARPARWEPNYTLYFAKLMGWDLSFGMTTDLRRLRAQARVGKEAADALFPRNSPIQQPIQPNGERGPSFDFAEIPPPGEPDASALRLTRSLELAFGPLMGAGDDRHVREAMGSNNWAVAPERTRAGYALLSGDPHLGLSLPSTWYEAHVLVADEFDVYGVTFPAIPYVTIGFNRDVAWSFTNTGADVIDYYAEVLDDEERPTRYLLDGEWRPLKATVQEYRGPKGRLLATDTVYFTHRGPLIEDGARSLSMRWTVLERSGESATAFARVSRAGSVEEWLRALEGYSAPAQNGIVADRRGSIAIRSTGYFPLHPDDSGLEVRDGTSSSSDWVGYWPLERYPFAHDPEQGYLASANQQPIDPKEQPTYLGADWPSPWRAIRINQLLAEDSAVTPDAMRRYHTDPGNARADYFVPFFLEAVKHVNGGHDNSATARKAARLLGEWDRRYTKDNERAVLFEYAMDELVERTWDELSDDSISDHSRPSPIPSSATLANLLNQPDSPWWDDRSSDGIVENRDAILVSSLAAALERTSERHGDPDQDGWRWEGIRHANINHVLGIRSLSARGLSVQGGPGNLNPSSGSGVHGASWRMVVELGPEVRAWSMYPGGQSGNPVSARYDDRVASWTAGELDAVLFPRSPSELEASRLRSTLTIVPEE